MNTGITSARYAKALLRFATENGEEERVYGEMRQLLQAFQAAPRLRVLLQNPALPATQQASLLVAAATTEKGISTSSERFMAVLCQARRADLAQYVAVSFQTQYREAKGLIEARLTTAVPATEDITKQMQKLVEQRTGRKVSFETHHDADLGAGFVLEYDTYRMDASLRRQFNDLRRTLAS